MSNVYSSTTITSDERLADLEARGEKARRECRSRNGYVGSSEVERKAFWRGWDRANEADRAACSAKGEEARS